MLQIAEKPNTTYEELMNTLEILTNVNTEHENHFTEVNRITYTVCDENKYGEENIFGNFARREICIDPLTKKTRPERAAQGLPSKSPKQTENVNDIKCEGKDIS